MNKLFYPAIFHVAEEGGFWITFPDLPECMTQGDNMQEAYEMAVDALGLALTSRELEKQVIPAASELSQIAVNKDEYCVIIEFDMLAYKKRTNSKAVKKTLSIPATAFLATSASAANPAASLTAISANILRLISIPDTFNPCIIWL